MKTWRRFIIALMCALPTVALAHPGHGVGSGFAAGLMHPWSGLDHLAAMLAVGLWAAQLGGRMRWTVPISFVALMLVGAVLGITGIYLGAVEQGIAASVCVLGLLLASAARLSPIVCMVLTGGFAVFHGYAHGMETPSQANALLYMSGFALSTIALHGAGLVLGAWLLRHQQQVVLRWSGLAIAASGLFLLVN